MTANYGLEASPHANKPAAHIIPNAVRDLSKRDGTHRPHWVSKSSWAGSFASFRMAWSKSRVFKRTVCAGLSFWGIVFATWRVLPKPTLLDGSAFSQGVDDRDGNVLRVTVSADQKFRIRTSLRDVSPALIGVTLQFEDKHFAQHCGVNPVALMRSATSILPDHARTGGSTITMQLARLRFHLQTRTIPGKATQILRALELERHYSKSEILEAYFNLAPYGRNIEGVAAASQIYFDRQPARLTQPEAIALSVIPQSPTRRVLFCDRENRSLNNAQNRWHDRISTEEDRTVRLFSAPAKPPPAFDAPHFVEQVLETNKVDREIVTTLDLAKQRLIQRRVSDYVAANSSRGIENAAVLLVDAQTMDVLAQIGSANFWDKKIDGQVDGTRSLRSPGSTLKPFVYGLAIEQGIIHPLSVLADAPRSFGEYNPENFDRDFLGPIHAVDALARSRNVPAVTLASELSHPSLYQFLNNAGVPLPQPESFYGLALPLGGAEISMQDLVRLYAALANNGKLRPLRHVNSKRDLENLTALSSQVCGGAREKIESETARKRVLSPEA